MKRAQSSTDTRLLPSDPFRLFIHASRPHWVPACLAILFVVAAATVNSFTPYVYKLIVDAALHLPSGPYTPLWRALALYFATIVIGTLLWRGSGFAGMRWSTGVLATARLELTSYLTLHSHEYFSNRFSGSLLSKVRQASDTLAGFVTVILWQFLGFFISLIVSLIILFHTNVLLGTAFFLLFSVAIPINIFFSRKRVPLSVAYQEIETRLNGVTVDLFANMTAVQEFARRNHELSLLKRLIGTRREAGLRNWQFSEWILIGNGLLQNVFIGVMILLAVYLASIGQISAGDIILLLSLVSMIEGQLTFIGSQLNDLAQSIGQVEESLTDILEPHSVADSATAVSLHVSKGSIEARNVGFSYAGRTIFSGLSFSVHAGQKVGLVGRSGAGKSTLMKLILRHYDLSSGSISIDGTDITEVTKESLRSGIAVVPQEPALFHRTIRENIAYGNPDATLEDVRAAARGAQADDFIMQLSDGYDTIVGERGTKLSGGQRQRVAIARAFLKNAPILLLDEATSALDSESESAVQESLTTLMQGRTVLAVAHRLSTLRAMDRILVFDNGTIVQEGVHLELITTPGIYADLWKHQVGGFFEEGTASHLTPGHIEEGISAEAPE